MLPQNLGGATQSGPKSAQWNTLLTKPDFTKKIPSLWKAWICFVAPNFSSEAAAEVYILPLQAIGVDAQEVPHGTHVVLLGRLMYVLASGITRVNPSGTAR